MLLGTAVDDYLHITLTDEQDVPDALARLRAVSYTHLDVYKRQHLHHVHVRQQ